MTLRTLYLTGDAYTIGQQHGVQVADLRPHILRAMEVRMAVLRQKKINREAIQEKVERVWEAHTPNTLAMLHGIADSLELPWEDFFPYTIASYLTDQHRAPGLREGCTTFAAAGEMTRNSAPMLVKNRDYRPDHQLLQCLARIEPIQGHPYLCLTSAGSPGVFSSGMNAVGLAVADTHVESNDIGPGIARYSLMMHLLEQFSRVSEAVDYLGTVPHFGDGTVILIDAQGDMAVFELAHSVQAVRRSTEGFLVSTNHFSAQHTRMHWVDTNPPRLRGNSQARCQHVETALSAGRGQVDVPWAQALMAWHGNHLDSICRHPEMEAHAVTIASVIFLPQQTCLYATNGLPCQTPFELHRIGS